VAAGPGHAGRAPSAAAGDREAVSPRLWRVNARHQKALAAAAALLAVPALSACGVNFGAQTDQVYTPSDGENHREGTVDVLNALIISETPGSGRLIAGLSNNDTEGADTLSGVVGAGNSQGITVDMQPVEVPEGQLVQLASEETTPVFLSGDPEALAPGTFVRVTFQFANADPATLNVPVLAPGETYADVELPAPAVAPEG
jgi:hypothetical protein